LAAFYSWIETDFGPHTQERQWKRTRSERGQRSGFGSLMALRDRREYQRQKTLVRVPGEGEGKDKVGESQL